MVRPTHKGIGIAEYQLICDVFFFVFSSFSTVKLFDLLILSSGDCSLSLHFVDLSALHNCMSVYFDALETDRAFDYP